MSTSSCDLSRGELGGLGGDLTGSPLVVSPKDAWRFLGVSNSTGYELLAAGELESIKFGRARRITMNSIHRLVERRLAASKTEAA